MDLYVPKKNTLLNAAVMYSWNHGYIYFFGVLFYYFDIFMPLKSKNILKINRSYNVKSFFMNYTCEMWAYEGDISWTKKRFQAP